MRLTVALEVIPLRPPPPAAEYWARTSGRGGRDPAHEEAGPRTAEDRSARAVPSKRRRRGRRGDLGKAAAYLARWRIFLRLRWRRRVRFFFHFQRIFDVDFL